MNKEEIVQKLCGIIRDILEDQEQDTNLVTCEQPLSDIGINSIHFISIIVRAEVEFDIEFEDDFLNSDKFADINSIADYILQLKC